MVKYILNQKEVKKPVFFEALRQESCRIVRTSVVGNGLGVDITQFEPAKYRAYQRKLQKGDIPIFPGSGNVFRRIKK